MTNVDDVHGLAYPDGFLDALPVLHHRPPPPQPTRVPYPFLEGYNSPPILRYQHQPIRVLDANRFADVHLRYLTTHAPDHVLFPFLHGLEGDNAQQNAFFTSPHNSTPIPRFRGLVWVAADADDADDVDAEDADDVDAEDADDVDAEDIDELDDDDYSESSFDSESVGPMDIDDDSVARDPTLAGPVVTGCPPPHALPPAKAKAAVSPVAAPPLLRVHVVPASGPTPTPTPKPPPAMLTSSFRPRELLRADVDLYGKSSYAFVEPKVPAGISLRNFGIQAPIYAALSDIIVYSPYGNTRHAATVAERFASAVEAKRAARTAHTGADPGVGYNVFVLEAGPAELARAVPHAIMRLEQGPTDAHTDGTDAHAHGDSRQGKPAQLRANTVDFTRREKEEMRDLTQASEIVSVAPEEEEGVALETWDPETVCGSTPASVWEPALGQVFLGNSNDVPLPPDRRLRVRSAAMEDDEDDWDWRGDNDPANGKGFDICIECHDFAPFPSTAHVRAAEEHVAALERRWIARCLAQEERGGEDVKMDLDGGDEESKSIPPRPPPSAAAVVHLPFPSSPPSSPTTLATLIPFLAFIERMIQPATRIPRGAAREQLNPRPPSFIPLHVQTSVPPAFGPSSLPPPSAFPKSFFDKDEPAAAYTRVRSTSATFLPSSPSPSTSSSSSDGHSSVNSSPSTAPTSRHPSASSSQGPTAPMELRTRPLKILIYSADGYTESSVLALCLLMALRGISLPEAYLVLQVEKRRSFFVYPNDLSVLRRVEQRLEKDRAARDARARTGLLGGRQCESPTTGGNVQNCKAGEEGSRPAGLSVSFAPAPAQDPPQSALSIVTAGQATHSPGHGRHLLRAMSESDAGTLVPGGSSQSHLGRPRASTLPLPISPSAGDHHLWFDDPRFEGSFPSRVLPFLYLGNLNHASNVFMLHALGITHVVSVGECALVPPPNLEASASSPVCSAPSSGAHFVPGKGPGGHGSLWIEEREGRIKVLDIKGVCDDGIDTLEPQLEPICQWIDRAREEGGKVLVHCRVGVSRSATVTIAYVMKHLNLPLVDAYLIVRSRRLSVLIQPNMRLLYNLLGWEVKLARERAGEDPDRLRAELARALNWPYLAKEVHALNEKYLH